MQNTNTPTSSSPSLNLRRLKDWAEDQTMKDDNYTVSARLVKGQPMGQFSLINVCMDEIGFYSANAEAAVVPREYVEWIESLQISDNKTVKQKMGWLLWGGRPAWGAPMKTSGYEDDDWRGADKFWQISAVYAGTYVEVLEQRTFNKIRFNGKVERGIPMSRLRTLTPQTWREGTTYPHLVQDCTAVSKNDGVILPMGKIRLPVMTKSPRVWVMDRWLAND